MNLKSSVDFFSHVDDAIEVDSWTTDTDVEFVSFDFLRHFMLTRADKRPVDITTHSWNLPVQRHLFRW